jgi:chemotaxis signal transduction protein
MNGIFVGFLVDSLNEVTEITGNYVSKPPQISNNYTCTYLNSIVKAQR